MLREKLDEYLDEGLDPAQRREVEALLASDPAAAAMLGRMKAQRALRAAAYESYLPTRLEAKTLADRVLVALYDTPAGHIGYWLRHGAAVAAAVAILTGVFAMGRMTAPLRQVPVVETRVEYNVVWFDAGGVQQVQSFATQQERNKYLQQLEQQGVTGVAVADILTPGHL
jgi:anti-sigma factor RsiW